MLDHRVILRSAKMCEVWFILCLFCQGPSYFLHKYHLCNLAAWWVLQLFHHQTNQDVHIELQKTGVSFSTTFFTDNYIKLPLKKTYILVGGLTPLNNIVSWDDEIPNWMESHNPFMFQTTNQFRWEIPAEKKHIGKPWVNTTSLFLGAGPNQPCTDHCLAVRKWDLKPASFLKAALLALSCI